jgi:hypothetical protein
MDSIRHKLPIGTVVMLLMLALVTMAVGYGLWSEMLNIHGTVKTGEVDAWWTTCDCIDYGLDPNPSPNPPKDKDVGSTACWIDDNNPHLMHVVVSNGYPSYWNNCEVHLQNTGTVPIKIRGYKVIPKNFTMASGYGEDDGEIWVKYWDGVDTQMDLCPHPSCEQASSLQFHVEQPALENHDYEFDVLVCVAQWNEDASMDECLEFAP